MWSGEHDRLQASFLAGLRCSHRWRGCSCDYRNNPQKTCSSAIRMGEMKLLVNNPGDSRTIGWPEPAAKPVPFGLTGGEIEPGTDHARAPAVGGSIYELHCVPFCLFVRQPTKASLPLANSKQPS